MPINENDGTAQHIVGKIFDNDGTAEHQVGAVLENDGTTLHEIWQAEVPIFLNGPLNNDITGGWKNVDGINPSWPSTGTQLNITLSNSWADEMWITNNIINLADYKKLKVTRSGADLGIASVMMYTSSVNSVWSDNVVRSIVVSNGEKEIDISTLNGSYALGFRFYGDGKTIGPISYNNIILE